MNKQFANIFHIISQFIIVLNNTSVIDDTAKDDEIENYYIDIFNLFEEFKINQAEIENIIYKNKHN